MTLPKFFVVIVLVVMLFVLCSGTGYAAPEADPASGLSFVASEGDSALGMSPIVFFFVMLAVTMVIGVIAVLGGVGGGVIFTPLMMGFTPIDSFIIRATGLFVAMAGALVAARPFLRRGLANVRLLFFAAVPYAVFAVIGALMAGYVKETAGDTGEALIRLILGLLVLFIALLILFAGKKVEYPEVERVDGFTKRLALATSYWEESLDKIVSYKVRKAPAGILMFCAVGLVSGLFGMGAGWAMVPVFNLVMLAPLKVAAASSKVLIGMGDTGAIWPYLIGGGIFPLFVVPCMLGLVLGTYIGTKLMFRVKASKIRGLVIVIMFGSGIKLLLDGITRLV